MRFCYFFRCASNDQVIERKVPDLSMLKPAYEPGSPLYQGYDDDKFSDIESVISDLTDHSDGYGERDETIKESDDDLTVLSLELTDVICLTRQPCL